jgi:hypothetical protein
MIEGNEEFNLEDVNFRPLTKGLGFHQKEVQKVLRPRKAQTKEESYKDQDFSSKQKSQLSSFYQNPPITKEFPKVLVQEEKNLGEESEQEKYYLYQSLSFMVDLIIILGLLSMTFLCFFYFSPLDIQQALEVMSSSLFFFSFFVLFSIYYITYFSFLDILGTPGKLCFGLRLAEVNREALTLKHTFLRSIITLSSFLVAFLPLIVDFHGKLSDSKVVKIDENSLQKS